MKNTATTNDLEPLITAVKRAVTSKQKTTSDLAAATLAVRAAEQADTAAGKALADAQKDLTKAISDACGLDFQTG